MDLLKLLKKTTDRVQENQENNVNKEVEIVKSNQTEILELEILTAALWAELHPSNFPVLKL